MSKTERKDCLDAFTSGELHVLCACDILNEGWDCPDVEVLLMARPTLSKVIYLQQLGRGTRKAPGKECLIVFDFVDDSSRYNQSLSLHRILGNSQYRAGALALAPHDLIENEVKAIGNGNPPTQVLPVELWTRDYQEIDVFNWQEAIADMLSTSDLEIELAASEGRIRAAVERGLVTPDHTLALGERKYFYFRRERADEIRETLGLPRVDGASIRELFLAFVGKMDMSSSYKPALLLSVLDHVDERGRARLDDVVAAFHGFYLGRLRCGLPVEKPGLRMQKPDGLAPDEVRTIMLEMPFRKFEQRKYLVYDKEDLACIRFQYALWRQLTSEDRDAIRRQCEEAISSYYERNRT